MELINNELIQNYSLEGEVLKGEVKVKNGKIEKCVITTVRDNLYEYELSDQEVRDMQKEFSSLISEIDRQKGVGNV